eukprot:TRINITY_DN20521_c0_g1_i3.p2 TRINITY_DN20521_c0_g1~~TRINITY_DN20521_c0_g1_i3.p2  ORF type:complete len:118 (+),score=27.91 TRINITY_DN20521_c0_g1_i3:352-705(+)
MRAALCERASEPPPRVGSRTDFAIPYFAVAMGNCLPCGGGPGVEYGRSVFLFKGASTVKALKEAMANGYFRPHTHGKEFGLVKKYKGFEMTEYDPSEVLSDDTKLTAFSKVHLVIKH